MRTKSLYIPCNCTYCPEYTHSTDVLGTPQERKMDWFNTLKGIIHSHSSWGSFSRHPSFPEMEN